MTDALSLHVFPGVPRLISAIMFVFALIAFVFLLRWGIPSVPVYMYTLYALTVICAVLAWRWGGAGIALTVALLPGITTISLTVFRPLFGDIRVGITGLTALYPVGGCIIGIWCRSLWRREEMPRISLLPWIGFFLLLTYVSAAITLWRYTDFWPLFSRTYPWDIIVNTVSTTSREAAIRIIKTVVNYTIGPLFLLAIVHCAWQDYARTGIDRMQWLLRWCVVPFLIGSAVPLLVGLRQTTDVFFGAHAFYVWPWMNRINATFFDPNAFGAYLVIFIPWLLACMCGVWQRRVTRAVVFVVCALMAGVSVMLLTHSGSRTSVVGIIVSIWLVGVMITLRMVLAIARRHMPRFSRMCVVAVLVGHAILVGVAVYNAPRVVQWLQRHPRLKTHAFVQRFDQRAVRSFRDIYHIVQADRGPYVQMAVEMIRSFPETGIGLGSFVTEFHHWKGRIRSVIYVPDTACNYYLQVASEQGVFVLLLVLVIFVLWWRQWWYAYTQSKARWYWLCIGAGMASVLCVFLFGMHTLANEIQCIFWLFAAQPFVCAAAPASWHEKLRSRYVWVPVLLLCGIMAARAATDLSLRVMRVQHGWDERFGVYAWEDWRESHLHVMHTRKEAQEMHTCNGIVFRQKWACLHPDITTTPVRVTLQLGDVETNVVVSTPQWHEFVVPVHRSNIGARLTWSTHVDRTWRPREWGAFNDTRDIGITVQPHVWDKNEGVYASEVWQHDGGSMSGKRYAWTGPRARILLGTAPPYTRMPLLVSHPDVTTTPVRVHMRINDDPWDTYEYDEAGWHMLTHLRRHRTQDAAESNDVLYVEVDRTWVPADIAGDDTRALGVAHGPMSFHAYFDLSEAERWQDEFTYRWAGRTARWPVALSSDGTAQVRYLIAHPDVETHPVTITLWTNGVTALEYTHDSAGWHAASLSGEPHTFVDCSAEVSRTWTPAEFGMPDYRALGFAVEKP